MVGGPRNFKHLPDISFDNSFQKMVLWSLLMLSYACYLADLDDNQ